MTENNDFSIENRQTYKATDIAKILDISLRAAYNLCENSKDFKVFRMGKRCVRVHKESFDKWFNSGQSLPS